LLVLISSKRGLKSLMNTNPSTSFDQFLEKLRHIPEGFSRGVYRGQRYKIIHTVENNGQMEKLFGENLHNYGLAEVKPLLSCIVPKNNGLRPFMSGTTSTHVMELYRLIAA
jgi:hypothetical protein